MRKAFSPASPDIEMSGYRKEKHTKGAVFSLFSRLGSGNRRLHGSRTIYCLATKQIDSARGNLLKLVCMGRSALRPYTPFLLSASPLFPNLRGSIILPRRLFSHRNVNGHKE
jgi:hypothetical protein